MDNITDELIEALQGFLLYFESGNQVPVDQATIKANSKEVQYARSVIAKVANRDSAQALLESL